jgi:hypothetical protein
VPDLTELEWLIKPDVEQWAEVATFDVPGVGNEPRTSQLNRQAIVDRGIAELEAREWDSCVVVADGWGVASAVGIAQARRAIVVGLALGHARISNDMEGERTPVNKEVWEALGRLLRTEYATFVRYGLTQVTHGSIADEQAQKMLEKIPADVAQAWWQTSLSEPFRCDGQLRELDLPMLFAKHKGCLIFSEEGFADAAAAFPRAKVVSTPDAPCVSSQFANELRSFCFELQGGGHESWPVA